MKVPKVTLVLVLGLLPLELAWPLSAQENVTISKSRLEELERKEKELEQIKRDLTSTKGENAQLKKENEKATAKLLATPPIEPVVRHVSPAMVSLPPLKPEDVVEAMDLANYYHADAAAADRRYHHKKLVVRGEIVGFEKPMFVSIYRILLKTPDRTKKVICELLPRENADAVFTVDHGEKLVALHGGKRVPMAKVGQTVLVPGYCQGARDSDVVISGSELRVAQ